MVQGQTLLQPVPAAPLLPRASGRPHAGARRSRRGRAASLPSARGTRARLWRTRQLRRCSWSPRRPCPFPTRQALRRRRLTRAAGGNPSYHLLAPSRGCAHVRERGPILARQLPTAWLGVYWEDSAGALRVMGRHGAFPVTP